MSFADPTVVTYNAVATNLPRTGQGPSSGSYKSNDGALELRIDHQFGKRNRDVLRLVHTKIAADPLMPSTNKSFSTTVSVTIDSPLQGYTVAEKKLIVDAVTAFLTASSGANATKLLGGEN